MPLPKKKDLPAIFFLGFIGITVYHLALTFGELKVTAGSASMLIASAPIFTAILAIFILKEKVKIWGWIGIIISFLGVSLVAIGEGGRENTHIDNGKGCLNRCIFYILKL